jgi:hypothetical protein
MLDEAILERRLAIIKQEIANLKRQSESNSISSNWLDRLIGSISDKSAFQEALEYGIVFRQADKPNDDREPA